MEIFGNPITGYTTQYYSEIIENLNNNKDVFYSKSGCLKKCNRNGIYHQKIGVKEKGNENKSSRISQRGLEMQKEFRNRVLQKRIEDSFVQDLFKVKAKSRHWAKRHHNYKNTRI